MVLMLESQARRVLGYEPVVSLEEGITLAVAVRAQSTPCMRRPGMLIQCLLMQAYKVDERK